MRKHICGKCKENIAKFYFPNSKNYKYLCQKCKDIKKENKKDVIYSVYGFEHKKPKQYGINFGILCQAIKFLVYRERKIIIEITDDDTTYLKLDENAASYFNDIIAKIMQIARKLCHNNLNHNSIIDYHKFMQELSEYCFMMSNFKIPRKINNKIQSHWYGYIYRYLREYFYENKIVLDD